MSSFILFTYQFSPINQERTLFPEHFINVSTNFKHKQEIFGKILGSDLVFHNKKSTYLHQFIFNENSIIVFKIANNKFIVQEDNFSEKKLPHNPSCLVLIDNRENIQRIYIEDKGFSFADTTQVASILETTFNEKLVQFGLAIKICREFRPQEFWNLVEEHKGKVKMVRFRYLYPNLPRVTEKIDELLAKVSGSVGSHETVFELNAGPDQSLDIDKDNESVGDLVDAASQSGSPITLRIKGLRRFVHVGESFKSIEIEDLEAKLNSDLLSTSFQKVIQILNDNK